MGHSSESSSSSGCSSATSSCPPDCSVDCCEALCASLVNCRLSSAVVRVHGQSVLTTVPPQVAVPTFIFAGDTQNAVMTETHGSGFLIKGNLIVCPASLVLIPQDVLFVAVSGDIGGVTGPLYRYPYVNVSAAVSAGIENTITPVSRILVDIFINEKGAFYTYEATIFGVNPVGDVALLSIDLETDWNGWNPCLKCCHPYFRWSKSRKTKVGDPIFIIGDLFYNSHDVGVGGTGSASIPLPSERVIYTGILTNNEGMDYTGIAQYELIVTDVTSGQIAHGAVILNNCGAVIGMFTCDVNQDVRNTLATRIDGSAQYDGKIVGGVSEFYMRWPLKAFLQGMEHHKFGKHVGTIVDAGVGNFYYYVLGYLGVNATPVTGADYSFFYGADGGQYPAMNASGVFPPVTCTENIGVRVITLAQTSPPQIFDPAGGFPITLTDQDPNVASIPYFASAPTNAQYPSIGAGFVPDVVNETLPFAASPLQGIVFPNDIIFQISKCKSSGGKLKKKAYLGNGGNGKRQIAPLLFTARTMPGDSVFVDFRQSSSYWVNFGSTQVAMQTFPLAQDYPFSSRSDFPMINAASNIIPQNNNLMSFYTGGLSSF